MKKNYYKFFLPLFFSSIALPLTSHSAECPNESVAIPLFGGDTFHCQVTPGHTISQYVAPQRVAGKVLTDRDGFTCEIGLPFHSYTYETQRVCRAPSDLSIDSTYLGLFSYERSNITVSVNHRTLPSGRSDVTVSGQEQFKREIQYKVVGGSPAQSKDWTPLATLIPALLPTSSTTIHYVSSVLGTGPLARNAYDGTNNAQKFFFRVRIIDEKNRQSSWAYSTGVWLYTDRYASGGIYGQYLAPGFTWVQGPSMPGKPLVDRFLNSNSSTTSGIATMLDRAPWSPGTNCEIFTFPPYNLQSGSTCVNYIVY